ncbi:MAG: hypothetical protein LBI06_08770 [Treponema sp.]|nr:hypothetical protein [Treponema sp.]
MLIPHSLFASGAKDSEETAQSNEWVLCITAFDYSLSPARRITGDVIVRDLVDKLKQVSYRFRISPEYAYYEGYAWQQAISTAARALSNKQNERSQLLYRGEANWKYRQNLKKLDADIEKLQETLALKEAQRPMINREPEFALTQGNLNGTFPAAPAAGAERRFLQNQKADAFLTGEIREFHGRYYIRLRLFALYTNSFIYEDDIIFSLEDTEGAVEEIAARLSAALAGNSPAFVAVRADVEEAQILINQAYAGRGTVEERERPPGKIIVAVAAEGFSPVNLETELRAGEVADIAISLSPLNYADVTIDAPGNAGAAVYHGALYVGEAPFTLSLPIDSLNYISVENSRGEMAKAAFVSPEMPDESFELSFKLKRPHPAEERRVDKARRWYYWAWGGTWLTGIAAWTTYGIYSSQNNALSRSSDQAFFDSTQRMYYISMGAVALAGVAVAYEIFRMARYMYTATENVTPIVKQERKRR